MDELERQSHWQAVYSSKGEAEVSWFEESPALSLELIAHSGIAQGAPIVDIGGGASRLVDALLDAGFSDITVLDIAGAALAQSRTRLGARAGKVRWVETDVTAWKPQQQYALWHDRAVFHFLTDADDRGAYVERLNQALPAGGQAIIGSFALDGPERCSGLPVVRYDAASLGRVLGDKFELEETRAHAHQTPWASIQRFQFSRFRKAR